jgi:class 3 adenylate cyclase/tetratricopeptide (TPR) repeat protein
MRCSKCKAENPGGKKFCGKCGARLGGRCPKCGAVNPPDATFCGDCGAALGAAEWPKESDTASVRVTEAAEAEKLEGERKTVTALFADIKGSTELEQDLDPEEARTIVDPALKLMIEAVHRYDGYVVQSTGDGIFALFGAPIAHEDHPQRALYSALRMQEEIRKYGDRLLEGGGVPLEIRVGVNTGEVVVRLIKTGEGHVEYMPIGHTTNLASRMQAVARSGSVVVSEQTRKLVEGYFQLKPIGPTRVKGVSEPVNVYEVTGLGPLRTRLQRSAGRGLSKFVGREREMEALEHAAEQAKAGRGQIVAAMAEAGVGKSRLYFEFKSKNQSGWMVLETFSVSHGKASAYLPTIELLHGYFRITSDDDARARREKIGGKVLMLDRKLEDALPYLFGLLGIVEGEDPLAQMDAQVRKRRTLDAVKRLLLRESLNQPLMVIFEDLHWIDDETQVLLNLLADSIGTAKILLLVNYRPEYSHQWGSKTYYTQLRLDPLGKESAYEMLTALLGADAQLAALKNLITEKTEGNPFFMEETVQVLLDEGALVRDGSAIRLTRPLGELKIPPTVQAILAARIDRLPVGEKELLQTLAVIGKEFPLSLVRAISGRTDDDLGRILNDLQLAEFIYEQPAMGDVEYTFKHALTLEVAYNSVLSERRRIVHGRVGEAIEAIFTRSLDDHLSELAHHYSRSPNTRKAVEYLGRTGRQALERYAFNEALAYLASGQRLLESLPDDLDRARLELALRATLAEAHALTVNVASPEVEQIMLRVRDLCRIVGDESQLFSALFFLRLCYMVRGELTTSREVGAELLTLAEHRRGSGEIEAARYSMGSTLLSMGDFSGAVAHLEQSIGLPNSPRSSVIFTLTQTKAVACSVLAQALCCLGYPDRARQLSREAQAQARHEGQFTLVLVLADDCELQQLLRDGPRGLQQAEAATAYAIEKGTLSQLGRIAGSRASALIESGQVEEGIAIASQMLGMFEAGGVGLLGSGFCALAAAYAKLIRPADGLQAVRKGIDLIQRTGERQYAAELFRLKGELELLANRDAFETAEASVRQAIETARAQSAKWWELRATVSLSRMLAMRGRRDEARTILADIYNWFTEGFDTADLKDAKALLDELNA